MPKILVIAATKQEIAPLLNEFSVSVIGKEGFFTSDLYKQLSVLITGVGMVNTAYYLGKYSHHIFDCVINAGICGAFNKQLQIGEVVTVIKDTLSEMGAENGPEFITYNDLNLGGSNHYQNPTLMGHAIIKNLKKVSGITVNKVHGSDESIKKAILLYNPDVESMEGAAFFRACDEWSKNYFQLRAVSNYVERRDKNKWNIPLAINNLNTLLIAFINDLNN